jgi:hypothetical protein
MLFRYPGHTGLLCLWHCNLCLRVSALLLLKGNYHAKLFFFLVCNSHLSLSEEVSAGKMIGEYVREMAKGVL